MNLIDGIVQDSRFVSGDLAFALPDHLDVAAGPCTFGVRPEEIAVVDAGGIAAEVVGIERLGGESVYHLNVAGHSIKALWRREDIASPNVDLAVDSAVVFARVA
ncbi:MAG: TOBE domain-containing protein [Gammaproteobacteria bacterium]|nr:TOBE domain-containing protein [Gammaproteobacteria bacterium]